MTHVTPPVCHNLRIVPNGISLYQFEAVLFDVDGTLVDSVGGCMAGLTDMFRKYGSREFTKKEIQSLVGIPLAEQIRTAIGRKANPGEIEEAIEFTIGRYAIHQANDPYFEPTVEALRLLHKNGWKTALVTSKNGTEMKTFWPKFVASNSVNITVCASDVTYPKPHADSIFHACKLLDTTPPKAIMIGDSIFDMRCAKSAGAAAIAVSYGSTDKDILLQEAPDLLFERPEELLAWIELGILEKHEKENDDVIRRTG